MNLYSLGSQLSSFARNNVVTHVVTFRRVDIAGVSELPDLTCSSGPVSHDFLEGLGLDISEQVRRFIIDADQLEPMFPIRAGDEIVLENGTRFRIVPVAGDNPWKWADQNQTSIRVIGKQLTIGGIV